MFTLEYMLVMVEGGWGGGSFRDFQKRGGSDFSHKNGGLVK